MARSNSTHSNSTRTQRPRWWHLLASAARRLVVFFLLWWAISEGDLTMLAYAVVVVPVAVATSMVLVPRPTGHGAAPGWLRRGWALVLLTGWFLRRSVAGGVDVARRALGVRVDLDPGYVHCPMRLPPGAGRIAVADLMNLMPGSLSVILTDEGLTLHVLDTSLPIPATVADLEERVAQVGGLPLSDS